ncbi:hypothetical protein [Clostridium tertium]|uniref:hypothetical protein n=1 Tax=Clostridium tertium TaxID=1559 RepID=UPI0024B36FDD|nr:hypothetical protein [Clostridium tertium]MDI9217340.1 hypothetical protein [Clostridium tertium]
MKEKSILTNQAYINYKIYNKKASSYKEYNIPTNDVKTIVYPLNINLDSCYKCCLQNICCCCQYCNIYKLFNNNNFPLYDVKIKIFIPRNSKYLYNSFCIDKKKTLISNELTCFIPYINPNSSLRFSFITLMKQSFIPPKVISFIEVDFHCFDPCGNYIKRTIHSAIFT